MACDIWGQTIPHLYVLSDGYWRPWVRRTSLQLRQPKMPSGIARGRLGERRTNFPSDENPSLHSQDNSSLLHLKLYDLFVLSGLGLCTESNAGILPTSCLPGQQLNAVSSSEHTPVSSQVKKRNSSRAPESHPEPPSCHCALHTHTS